MSFTIPLDFLLVERIELYWGLWLFRFSPFTIPSSLLTLIAFVSFPFLLFSFHVLSVPFISNSKQYFFWIFWISLFRTRAWSRGGLLFRGGHHVFRVAMNATMVQRFKFDIIVRFSHDIYIPWFVHMWPRNQEPLLSSNAIPKQLEAIVTKSLARYPPTLELKELPCKMMPKLLGVYAGIIQLHGYHRDEVQDGTSHISPDDQRCTELKMLNGWRRLQYYHIYKYTYITKASR